MPLATFTPQPHTAAARLIAGKKAVARTVFEELLPELKMRAFTVTGIEDARVLQALRDQIAAVPLGMSWDDAKAGLAADLTPWLGEKEAIKRAQTLLHTHVFTAYSASTYQAAQADEDTTHLQYIHGDTARVPTPSHLALDGIVLPKNDPFWETHTGPWGHFGCVCYVRPMNPDQVDMVREADADKNPEDRNVIEGAALDQLRQGNIIRGTRALSVAADPVSDGFGWNPRTVGIPLADVQAMLDPLEWADFERKARTVSLLDGRTLWEALNS